MNYILDIAISFISNIVFPVAGTLLSEKLSDKSSSEPPSPSSYKYSVVFETEHSNIIGTIIIGLIYLALCLYLYPYYLSIELLCNIVCVFLFTYVRRTIIAKKDMRTLKSYRIIFVIFALFGLCNSVTFMLIHTTAFQYLAYFRSGLVGVIDFVRSQPNLLIVSIICTAFAGKALFVTISAYLALNAKQNPITLPEHVQKALIVTVISICAELSIILLVYLTRYLL